MKKTLLAIFTLLSFNGFSQATVPPPIGTSPWYAIDLDNDGSAPFDVATFTYAVWKVDLENFSGQSLSGYDLWANTEEEVPLTPIYYNTSESQIVGVTTVYNGNGPVFQSVPIMGWPMPLEFFRWQTLNAIPFDGDADNDGISNQDEDLNGNLVLNDDNNGSVYLPNFMNPDDDGDGTPTIEEDYNGNGNPLDDDTNANGIPDYLDLEVTLATIKFEKIEFALYPNPASDKVTMVFANENSFECSIYDASGRMVLQESEANQPIDVSPLAAGNYLVKATSGDKQYFTKLIIQ